MGASIDRIETFFVNYPVAGHFKFFAGPPGRPGGRPTVVVKISDQEGAIGWGQSVPSPRWSYETPETVASTIQNYLGPELIGRDPFDVAGIHAAMNRAIAPSFSTGQPLAKAGIDLALFDLTGRRLGQSAAQRWGRQSRPTIPLSWTLNPEGLDQVAGQIEQATAKGYRSFNIKVGTTPSFDLELCRLARQLAPEAFVWVDANGGYDVETALAVAPRFAELGMAALEQPVPANQLNGFRRLKQQGALPILMDEGIVSRADLEQFLSLGLLDGVAMKVSRCGGLSEAYRVLELVEEAGLLFFASGLTDPDLSLAASLALFAAFDLQRPAALNGPQFLDGSLLQAPLVMTAGQLPAPTGHGLGVDVDEEKVRSGQLRRPEL